MIFRRKIKINHWKITCYEIVYLLLITKNIIVWKSLSYMVTFIFCCDNLFGLFYYKLQVNTKHYPSWMYRIPISLSHPFLDNLVKRSGITTNCQPMRRFREWWSWSVANSVNNSMPTTPITVNTMGHTNSEESILKKTLMIIVWAHVKLNSKYDQSPINTSN